jgi:menaquinol-cytochrome c reductase iron-sulfur subunit
MTDDTDRRKFLKVATCGLGAGIGLAVGVPVLSMLVDPARRRTVTTPREPIDLGDPTRLGPDWQQVDVIAPVVRDAWASARNVVLGSAYLRKRDRVEALSAACPHLGCTVGWQPQKRSFLCACHDSVFAENGDRGDGPTKRGLDPLPIEVRDGRLRLTWIRYKLDTATREPT